MNIPSSSPRLLSPASGFTADTLLISASTDVQDSVSSHGDQQTTVASEHSNQTMSLSNHDHSHKQPINAKKNLKTEYKSNFTPFDQYVYNEVTDSFVKQTHQQLAALSSSNGQLNLSKSNQDLASLQDSVNASGPSPVLNASAFEPLNDANDTHTSEPWYKEVVKRNEKAHEYRYKSEVGHNSPMSKAAPSDENLNIRSPCGNDPSIEAQIRDGQAVNGHSVGSKPSFRFSPQDYHKRDHLISHMANNNNFNLPKEQSGEVGSSALNKNAANSARRAQTASSSNSRPLVRSTAQQRARSQCSRKPTGATATSATSASKATQPASKSNQTTPTKTRYVTPRVTTAPTPRTPLTVSSTTRTTASRTSARPANTTTTSSSGAPKPGITSTVSSTSASSRRPPTVTKTTTKVSSVSSSSPRTTTASSLAKTKPATTGSSVASSRVTSTTPRSPLKRATPPTATGRSSGATPARSTAGRNLPSSASGTARTQAKNNVSSSSPSGNTTAVKSIKTPKALASAQEKAAAAAAAAATVTGAVAAAGAAAIQSSSDAKPDGSEFDQVKSEIEAFVQERQLLQEQQPDQHIGSHQLDNNEPNIQLRHEQHVTGGPNLIFTTTEAGNMLADELAQAEEAAINAYKVEEQHEEQQVNMTEQTEAFANVVSDVSGLTKGESCELNENNNEPIDDLQIAASESEQSNNNELINGLEGGLISAEDRFDSTERETSGEINQQQDGGDSYIIQQGQTYDDQPYSIIPTSFDDQLNKEQPNVEAEQHEVSKNDNLIEKDQVEGSVRQNDKVEAEFGQQNDSESKDDLGESNLGQHQHDKVEIQPESSEDYAQHEDTSNEPIEHMDNQVVPDLVGHQTTKEADPIEPEVSTPDVANETGGTHSRSLSPQNSDNDDDKIIIGQEESRELVDSKMGAELKLEDQLEDAQNSTNLEAEQLEAPNEDYDKSAENSQFVDEDVENFKAQASDHNLEITSSQQEHDDQEEPRYGDEKQPDDDDELDSVTGLDKPDVIVNHDIDEVHELAPTSSEESADVQLTLSRDKRALDDDSASELVDDNLDANVDEKVEARLNLMEQSTENESVIDEYREEPKELSGAVMSPQASADVINDEPTRMEPPIELVPRDEEARDVDIMTALHGEDLDQHQFVEQQARQTIEAVVPEKDNIGLPQSSSSDNDDIKNEDEQADETSSKAELLMNVADLVEFEARKKQEMIRKAELARQSSSPSSPIPSQYQGEMLLSADQLTEQFAQLSGDSDNKLPERQQSQQVLTQDKQDKDDEDETTEPFVEEKTSADHNVASSISEVDVKQIDVASYDNDDLMRPKEHSDDSQQRQQQQQINAPNSVDHASSIIDVQNAPRESINTLLDLEIPSSEDKETSERQLEDVAIETSPSAGLDLLDAVKRDQEDSTFKQTNLLETEDKAASELDLWNTSDDKEGKPQSEGIEEIEGGADKDDSHRETRTMMNLAATHHLSNYDDLENEEQLKLSNHLTNSDDELILDPRSAGNLRVSSSSRYNEGAGLGLVAQDDEGRIEADSAELADGSSAAFVAPTMAEKNVEVLASKLTTTMPELSQGAAFILPPKLTSDEDSDDELLDLNEGADPTDVAATMSPSSSVASELLRLQSNNNNNHHHMEGGEPTVASVITTTTTTTTALNQDIKDSPLNPISENIQLGSHKVGTDLTEELKATDEKPTP